MEKELEIPEGITLEADKKTIKVSGEKGQLERSFKYFHDIKIEKKEKKLIVSSKIDKRKVKAMVGTIIAHVKNMIKGVKKGYIYNMKIVYSHFPMNVTLKGNVLEITNLCGGKSPRKAKILPGVKLEIKGKEVIATGIDKENVSQTCANIETATKLRGKDRRIFQDGIYIVNKGK